MADTATPSAAEEKQDQLQAAPGVHRPRVYFDIAIDDNNVGRIVFELFSVRWSYVSTLHTRALNYPNV